MSITAIQRNPAPAALEPAPPRAPVLPDADTWRTMVNMAQVLKASNLLPRHITSPEAAVAIILRGWELGVPAMQALADIYLIEGKLTCSANLMAALIYSRMGGNALRVTESTPERCVIEYRRPDWPSASRLEWTLDMAARAGLAGRDNWKKFPEAMLRARCISAVARLGFNDVVMGMYLPEELNVPVRVTAEGEVEPEPGAIEATVATPPTTAPAPPSATPELVGGKPEPETRRAVPKAPAPSTVTSEWWAAIRASGWRAEEIQSAAQTEFGRAVQNLDADQLAQLRDAATSGRVEATPEGTWRVIPVGGEAAPGKEAGAADGGDDLDDAQF